MGSSSQQTQSTTVSQPWSVQQPYLEQAFGGASNALGTAQGNAASSTYGAPSQFLAPYNPSQLATFQSMVGYGQNSPIANEAQSTAQSYINPAESATAGAASGLSSFNPFANNNIAGASAAGNQYAAGANIPGQVAAAMLPAEQAAEYGQLPQMSRTAAATGNTNSSTLGNNSALVQMGLGQQAEGLAANLEGQYYNTGAGLYNSQQQANNQQQLGALGAEGNLGLGAGNAALSGLSGAIGDQSNLFTQAGEGGAGLQQAAQNPLTNQLQAYNFGQSSPFQALDNFYNIIGSGQWGGTSNTSGTTTYNPSALQMVGGLLGTAGSLFGGQGMFGANGALNANNGGWW